MISIELILGKAFEELKKSLGICALLQVSPLLLPECHDPPLVAAFDVQGLLQGQQVQLEWLPSCEPAESVIILVYVQ
jgi:hypothetical protein